MHRLDFLKCITSCQPVRTSLDTGHRSHTLHISPTYHSYQGCNPYIINCESMQYVSCTDDAYFSLHGKIGCAAYDVA